MTHDEILSWLREADPGRLEALWQRADAVRRRHVGDEVHLRGLIEFSNHCSRLCGYCGLRADNAGLARYRMSGDEILKCARQAAAFGYGTVVMQSGEDRGCDIAWLCDVLRRIKQETPLAVTLSIGERSVDELRRLRSAGADRYLLRFETSDPVLYERIHPSLPGIRSDRIDLLRRLRDLGYQVGSGIMVGIPGQTYESVARDIALFAALDLDMIGIGPYIPHPATPLGQADAPHAIEQIPATEEIVYKAVALTRIICPEANIPSTTALATVNKANGRELGLMRGANVVMPNMTPRQYRRLYEIYPAKACVDETAGECQLCLLGRIASIGRVPGSGQGGRQRNAV